MTFKEQLNALSAVKFPLILAVVCIHVQNSPIQGTFDWYFVKFWGEGIGRIGVPLFFFISGVMFFCNVEKGISIGSFMKEVLLNKVKRRLRTLLIPYIIWNIVAYVFFTIKDCQQPTFYNLIQSMWNYRTLGYWFFPADGVLWFVRDLFIVSVFATPLLYIAYSQCAKKYLGGVIVALALAYALLPPEYKGRSLSVAFLLFSMGAGIGINRLVIVDFISEYKKSAILLYIILLSFFLFGQTSPALSNIIKYSGQLIGAFAFIPLAMHAPMQIGKIKLTSLSMFIFVTHGLVMRMSFLIMNRIEFVSGTIWIEYILLFVITVALCTVCYIIAEKVCPRLLSLSIGGR